MSIKHCTLDFFIQEWKEEIFSLYKDNERISDSAKFLLTYCLDEAINYRNIGNDLIDSCFFHMYTNQFFGWSEDKSVCVLKELTSNESDLMLRVIYEKNEDNKESIVIVDFIEISSAVRFAAIVKKFIDREHRDCLLRDKNNNT